MATDSDLKQIDSSWAGTPEFAKLFEIFKMPSLADLAAFIDINKRNMEALTAVHRVALDGAQAVVLRQMEIVRCSLTEVTDGMRAIAAAETPQAKAAKQVELAKQAYGQGIANMKELTGLVQRAHAEALDALNLRLVAAMDEVKALAEKAAVT